MRPKSATYSLACHYLFTKLDSSASPRDQSIEIDLSRDLSSLRLLASPSKSLDSSRALSLDSHPRPSLFSFQTFCPTHCFYFPLYLARLSVASSFCATRVSSTHFSAPSASRSRRGRTSSAILWSRDAQRGFKSSLNAVVARLVAVPSPLSETKQLS